MGRDGQSHNQERVRVETVRGEPFTIDDRTLIPEVRVVSFGRARATIASQHYGGWGGAFIQVTPRAMVEETSEGERRVAVVDATSRALWGLAVAAVVTTILLTAIRWWARRSR